jgi:hypothetical protein
VTNILLDAYMRNEPLYETTLSKVNELPRSAVLFSIYVYNNQSRDKFYICNEGIYRKRVINNFKRISLVSL